MARETQVRGANGVDRGTGGSAIRRYVGWSAICLGLVLNGCSSKQSGPELIPVRGTVRMNGKPLTTGGSISFRDGSGLIQPTGEVGPDGTYSMFLTPQQEGVPAGKYKVVVFASETREEAARHNRLPVMIINHKYLDAKTTPLATEVKKDAAPGAYDFSVTN